MKKYLYKIINSDVSVIGISKKGISAALLAKNKGNNVFMSDIKSDKMLEKELAVLREKKIPCETGINSEKILESNIIVRCSGVPFDVPILKKARNAGIPILDEIEFASLYNKAKIIAITGTNGKTTNIEILSLIFKKAGKKVFKVGNSGIPFSSVVLKAKKRDVILMEVSCLHLEDLQYLKPDISFITNITPDHLDRYGSMARYATIKGNILKHQSSKDYSIINADDKYSHYYDRISRAKKYYISCKSAVKQGVYIFGDKIAANMLKYNNKILCNLKDLGIKTEYNYPNILGAVAIAITSGVKLSVIRKALEEFSGVKHRFEDLGEFNGIKVINDSKATNEDATINALRNCKGSIILILGGRDKNSSFNKIKKCLPDDIKAIVYYGEVKNKIYNTLKDKAFLVSVKSLDNAIDKSVSISKKGDTILFSPSCSVLKNQFENAEKRGEYFKVNIRKLLRRK